MIFEDVIFEDHHEPPDNMFNYLKKVVYIEPNTSEEAIRRGIPTYVKWWEERGEDRFKKLLLNSSNRYVDTYLLFIITAEQAYLWNTVLDRYNLYKYIHYQSEDWVRNSNYPDKPPRLKTFILRLPKGYALEV